MYVVHVTQAGQRWDQLADLYYGDPFGYGGIISANPGAPVLPTLPGGLTLYIPVITPAQQALPLPPWLTSP
jgi:phage tail protein X